MSVIMSNTSKLYAPNGMVSRLSEAQYALVRTPEFKRWFGYWDLIPQKNAYSYYSEFGVREITHGLKIGNPDSIAIAAHFLSRQVLPGDVLVSIPGRSGCPSHAHLLANAIAEITGAISFNGLCGSPHESMYEAKYAGKNPRQVELGFYLEKELPEADNYWIVDNVIGTGTTMFAAQSLIPGSEPLVYAVDETKISKVVDENLEPMVVYHGTTKEFTIFDLKFAQSQTKQVDWGKMGFFFAAKRDLAEDFTRHNWSKAEKSKFRIGARIIECFLSVKNPFEITARKWTMSGSKNVVDWRNELINNGYDGYFITPFNEDDKKSWLRLFGNDGIKELINQQYVAFYPNQIKLAGGTNVQFNPDDPDIRFYKGGSIAAEQ